MKRPLQIGLSFIFIIALWILLAPFLATFLIVQKGLQKADAMVVLSGSAEYKERTQMAAELFSQGIASRIFITDDGGRGGWSQSEGRNLPFVELAERELIAGGVPADAITVLPGKVSGTDDEAKAVAGEVAERPLKSLLLVTSPFHTRRALRTFERILANSGVEVGIEHTQLDGRSPNPWTWWLGRRGWRTIGSEYVKSAVYYVYY